MSIHNSPISIMAETLGLILLLLPLVAPLIAQDTTQSIPDATECRFYNETCAKTEEGCPPACCLTEQDSFSRCFVTWTNSSKTGIVVLYKGCIFHQDECQERCISHRMGHKNGSLDGIVLYCCCYGNNCNDEFFWEPKESTAVEQSSTPIDMSTGLFESVTVTLGILILFFILAGALLFFYRRRKLATFIELPTVDNNASHLDGFAANICSRPIQLLEIKAQGRFGAVWKATYCNNYIAVKIFPQQDYQSWMMEKRIYSLPHMKHENVLQFIGVDEKGTDRLNKEYWLITSYHENGSLYDFLKGNVVSFDDVCRLGESISRGLAFLHCELPVVKVEGVKPAIAHRDFKSKNVLIKSNMTACIADFGLALTFYPGVVPSEAHGQVGTRRYMAPEVLEGAICFQRDAFLPIDMYACALVLWELLTRCTAQDCPVPEYMLPFEKEVGQHPTLDDMQDCVVTKKIRPMISNSWMAHSGLRAVSQMITETWDHDAEARLSASCIVERFLQLSHRSHHVSTSPVDITSIYSPPYFLKDASF